MKHFRKIILKSFFLTLLVIIIGFVLITVITGKCIRYKYKEKNVPEYLSHWMEYIKDDVLINDIVIPGSHDSGCYDMVYVGETQKYTIKEQLEIGTRYFDIRINNNDNDYVIYHSIINGVQAEPIFKDISDFIKNHPTEFLILDFQHFSNSSQPQVVSWLNEYLNDYLVYSNVDMTDLMFISRLKLSQVRGKCLVLFGENSNEISEYNYIFSRNNDDCSNKGQVLDSYYVTELNSKKSKTYIEEVIPFYISKIKDKITNEGDKGLFVLQGQLTDAKLIFGPWSRERSHEKNMSKYIQNLKNSEDLSIINIIMRDFINESKTKEIIKLNINKNNVKEENLNIFE